MTNADRLRSLSDEQYANLIYDMHHCDWIFSCDKCAVCKFGLKGTICCEMDIEMIRSNLGKEQEVHDNEAD